MRRILVRLLDNTGARKIPALSTRIKSVVLAVALGGVSLLAVAEAKPPAATAEQSESVSSRLARAAVAGDLEAAYRLAVMYEKGEGVAADQTEAVSWLTFAENMGHVDAMFAMAQRQEEGRGVDKDTKEALGSYLLGARRGHVLSYKALLERVMAGNVPADVAPVVLEYVEEQARKGEFRAQFALGLASLYGNLVPRDVAKAADWFRKLEAIRNAQGAAPIPVETLAASAYLASIEATTGGAGLKHALAGMESGVRTTIFAMLGAAFLFCLFSYTYFWRMGGIPLLLPLGKAETLPPDEVVAAWRDPAAFTALLGLLTLAAIVAWGGALLELAAHISPPGIDAASDWKTHLKLFLGWQDAAGAALLGVSFYTLCLAALLISFLYSLRTFQIVRSTGLCVSFLGRKALPWANWQDIARWEVRKSWHGDRLAVVRQDGRGLALPWQDFGEHLEPLLPQQRK